ncbi:hypothetical protein PR001_g32815 [Phytophthora rubi]|uniref:Uncharacterized protein n=1 Tax=Phytophthora rubi TaxID=129364 RepID=A0A6A3GIF1_9STRA|nr:hypothetical protein PR001_g32815 [Phytophthora rubi]
MLAFNVRRIHESVILALKTGLIIERSEDEPSNVNNNNKMKIQTSRHSSN